jgi:RIO kinase 1
MGKIRREEFKIEKSVFDLFTVGNLKKLESKGFFEFESLIPLFLGKEANIFVGEGEKGYVAVKIYRVENCDFNRMFDYIKLDPRYSSLKRKRRDIIMMWVQREYKNLLKAREGGARVPTPYAIANNVLVMELVGEPALKIKDDIPENPALFYLDVVAQMKKLFNAGLVHADLSQFNILNYGQRPVLIDFSQATTIGSFRAGEYLRRDLTNVNNFFRKLGVKEKELKTIAYFQGE